MTFYRINEALEILDQRTKVAKRAEIVSIFEATNRVLFEDVAATRSLPPFDNSTMDGYGVKLSDAGKGVKIVSEIFAGDKFAGSFTEGECVKIMTGAVAHSEIEAVVPFEDASFDGEYVTLPASIKPSQNIRKMGEELRSSEVLIRASSKLNPSNIALLASQGITAVAVYQRLKITVISGGNEVIEPWQEIESHQIYNTNSTALVLSLKDAGFDASYAQVSRDDLESMKASFADALASSDVVITAGGISVGDADYTKEAFEAIGTEILFHGLNIKPGKPTMAGVNGNKLVVALPGNPLSALANLHILILPILRKIGGLTEWQNSKIAVTNDEELNLKGNRDQAIFGTAKNGKWRAYNAAKYGSGMLKPIASSNAIVLFDATQKEIKIGETLEAFLLD